jgi:superfamily II DNA or RNA helicase
MPLTHSPVAGMPSPVPAVAQVQVYRKRKNGLDCLAEAYGFSPPASGSSGNLELRVKDVEDALRAHSNEFCNRNVDIVKHGDVGTRRWNFSDAPTELVVKGMELRDGYALRSYQATALEQLFDGPGAALSAIAKMPCAAGKTIWALSFLARLQTFGLIVTNSGMASLHWEAQLKQFFHPPDRGVLVLVEGCDFQTNTLLRSRPGVVIATYQLLTSAVVHGDATGEFLKLLLNLPYGLVIMDEAQTAVANTFNKVLTIPTKLQLAVSATYMRQDDKMGLLSAVGPQLVHVTRQHLIDTGVLPDILRVEVILTPTTPPGGRVVNDERKLAVAVRLVEFHIQRHDRIIVFCDDLHTLGVLKGLLDMLLGEGAHCRLGPINMHTPASTRAEQLQAFRDATHGVICMSRVGDTALDLPGANVLVQVGCASESDNQEVQRTGRIQRRASSSIAKHPHVAYTLIASVQEANNAESRRRCMDAEGYKTVVAIDSGERPWPEPPHEAALCASRFDAKRIVERWAALKSPPGASTNANVRVRPAKSKPKPKRLGRKP